MTSELDKVIAYWRSGGIFGQIIRDIGGLISLISEDLQLNLERKIAIREAKETDAKWALMGREERRKA